MNCQKYTRNQASNILVHCNRSDPNRTYGNQEIDHSKTHLNYNLAPKRKTTDFEFMKNRCEEFGILKRRDINWMVSWVVTMPQDYTGDKELFFDRSYEFLTNKYGESNVISAYVHLDETSPHMHFTFVPVVLDVNKQEYKVNAKKCITKYQLQTIHSDMQNYLEKELHTEVNLLNGATKEGNKTIRQLKEEQKVIDLAVKELIINPTPAVIEKFVDVLPEEEKQEIVDSIREEIKPIVIEKYKKELEEQKDELKEEIEELQLSFNDLSFELNIAKSNKRNEESKMEAELQKARNQYFLQMKQYQEKAYEEVKEKPSFINKLIERVTQSRFVATVCFVRLAIKNEIPIPTIMQDIKKFHKDYDFYMQNDKTLDMAYDKQNEIEGLIDAKIYNHNQDIANEINHDEDELEMD